MNYVLLCLFFLSTVLGQFGAIPLGAGITLYCHDIVLLVLIAYVVFHLPKKLYYPKLLAPIVIFFAVCVLSLLVNMFRFPPQELLVSALYALRWVGYAALYLIVLYWPLDPLWWLWGLYSAGCTVAGLGLVQYTLYPSLRNLTYLGWDPHLYRVFSTLLDPNFAAMVFVLTMILGMYLWTRIQTKWVVGAMQLLTIVALYLTYSRSGYLALIIGIMVFASLLKQTRVAIAIIILFLAMLFVLPRPGGEGVRLLRTASTFARVGNWQRGMTLIRERPIVGHGFNTLRYIQRQHGWTDASGTVSRAGAGVDNSLQFVWATTGIVGVLAYLWLFFSMASLGARAVYRKRHTYIGVVTITSIVALIIHSQFSNSLFYPVLMIWMWILVGAAERLLNFGTAHGDHS